MKANFNNIVIYWRHSVPAVIFGILPIQTELLCIFTGSLWNQLLSISKMLTVCHVFSSKASSKTVNAEDI